MNFGESKIKHNIIPNKALTTKNMETLKVIVPKSRTMSGLVLSFGLLQPAKLARKANVPFV